MKRLCACCNELKDDNSVSDLAYAVWEGKLKRWVCQDCRENRLKFVPAGP